MQAAVAFDTPSLFLLYVIHHLVTVKASAFLSGMLLPTAATPDEGVELAVPAYIRVSVTDSQFISG